MTKGCKSRNDVKSVLATSGWVGTDAYIPAQVKPGALAGTAVKLCKHSSVSKQVSKCISRLGRSAVLPDGPTYQPIDMRQISGRNELALSKRF